MTSPVNHVTNIMNLLPLHSSQACTQLSHTPRVPGITGQKFDARAISHKRGESYKW